MQSGPANQLYRAALQVEILGQYGLDVLGLSAVIHRFAELDYAAELITTAILRVGQDELRVVLSGHGSRLRPVPARNCEPLLSLRNEISLNSLSH